jgi:superfamily II DNA helicase RecQ
MQQYAYVKSCRRAFVLRYFGDPAATAKCAGCDNCLGTRLDLHGAGRTKHAAPGKKRAERDTRGAVSSGRRPTDDDPALDPAGEKLLTKLRTLRSTIAKDEQVPAYVVFSDRTLMEIASRRPKNLDALEGVRGVGPVKLERYGERFLDVVRDADETEAA